MNIKNSKISLLVLAIIIAGLGLLSPFTLTDLKSGFVGRLLGLAVISTPITTNNTSDTVEMYYSRATSSWVVRAPDGSLINTNGSTCDGLPEAVTYAQKNGYNLHVDGGQLTDKGRPSNHTEIICHNTLWLPPLQHASIVFESVTLAFPPGIGNNPGLVFDSAMLLDFKMSGQIAYAGTGRAVYFFPRSPVPLDNVPGMVDSTISFIGVAMEQDINKATAEAAVAFDMSSAAIQRVKFEFQEVNGGNTGIMVFSPPNSTGFLLNDIRANVHGSRNTGVSIGHAPTNHIYGNRWFLNIQSTPSGASLAALISWAQNDFISVNIQDGEIGKFRTLDGIKLENSASKNHIFVGRNDAKNPVNDQSSAKNNKIYK